MIDKLEVWRQQSWVWWVPLLFVSLNIGSILFFQGNFAGQLDKMETTYDKQADQLQNHKNEVDRVEGFLKSVEDQERLTSSLYREHFATESERFTRVLREIRTLARRAGLDPKAFSYPGSEIGAYELTRLGIRFSVNGTYDQLRTFINFLELTDQFLTLESVTLGGGKGDRDAQLKIRIGVSTIFAQNDASSLELPEALLEEQGLPAEPDLSNEPGLEAEGFAPEELGEDGVDLDEEVGERVEGVQSESLRQPARQETTVDDQEETL